MKRLPQTLLFALALAGAGWGALALGATAEPPKVLFDFGGTFHLTHVKTTDAHVAKSTAQGRAGLRVTTGHQKPWPGITLPAPSGHWDLSPWAEVELSVRNLGNTEVTVYCRVDNPGADGRNHCVTGSIRMAPGVSGTLHVPLKRTTYDRLGGKLFGMRGYPVKADGAGTVNPRQVTQLLLFVSRPHADHEFAVSRIRAAGRYTPPTAWTSDAHPFFPFIDTFGQYSHKDWPGKVHSLAQLRERRKQEASDLAAHPGPADWDRFGGWATGPKLEATGFFRTTKYQGKWWLVDPDGHLFFSQGIDCVGALGSTPIAERQSWFADFPGHQPAFRQFLSRGYTLKGHYAGQRPECFSFEGANLLRKYGPDWRSVYPKVIQRRLRSWGLNTIGNWSSERVWRLRRTPYTDAIGSNGSKMIQGSAGYWGKFPDVFDPSFARALRASMARKVGSSAGDPWCLGYFSDNEMSWGNDVSLSLAALASPPDQAAKRQFIADLKRKYHTIDRLNSAWDATCASWDALLHSTAKPNVAKARPDLEAFYTETAERYFRTVREVIHERAPHQLYLGCRFAAVNARAAAAAAKYCDVVSYNLYRRSVAHFVFNGGKDVPLIIGEFHFGALDRGMFHTGLVPVANQQARAQAYRNYVLGALRHRQFVGCHWFQYQDEPTTGRVYDGENYQIGFVDVADTPYAETIRAARQLGAEMYAIRSQ